MENPETPATLDIGNRTKTKTKTKTKQTSKQKTQKTKTDQHHGFHQKPSMDYDVREKQTHYSVQTNMNDKNALSNIVLRFIQTIKRGVNL